MYAKVIARLISRQNLILTGKFHSTCMLLLVDHVGFSTFQAATAVGAIVAGDRFRLNGLLTTTFFQTGSKILIELLNGSGLANFQRNYLVSIFLSSHDVHCLV